MDWADWRKTIDHTVADHGQWVGLCDGWGKPLIELPFQSLTAPSSRLSVSTLALTMDARGGSHVPVHPAVELMIADGLGQFSDTGELVVKDHIVDMVAIQRPSMRRGYVTSYPAVSGAGQAPTQLKVTGTDLKDRLAVWPCPSIPRTWMPNWELRAGDVVTYDTPRTMASIDMALVADGYTVTGPAELTIKHLVQDSFDAVNTQNGWGNTPHLVVDMTPTGRHSETIHIQTDDRMLLETIVAPAQMAGVNITVDLWWPGDPPVLTRTPDTLSTTLTTWDRAIGVVKIEQTGG